MYELRKQHKKTEKIEVINKGLFKTDRETLREKARKLQKQEPEFFFWVFNNQKHKEIKK
jgi:hypothetical protein